MSASSHEKKQHNTHTATHAGSSRTSVLKGHPSQGIAVRIIEDEILINNDHLLVLEVTYKSDKWVIRRKLSEILLFLHCNIEVTSNFPFAIESLQTLAAKEHEEFKHILAQYIKEISEHFNLLYIQSVVFFDIQGKGVGEEYIFKSSIVPKILSCIRCGFLSAKIYFTVVSSKPNLEDWKRCYVVVSDCVSFYENDVTYRNMGQPEYKIPLDYFTFLTDFDNKNEFKVATDTAVLCFRCLGDEFAGWERFFNMLPDML